MPIILADMEKKALPNIFDKDYIVVDSKLLCPNCFSETSIDTIMENSTFAWVAQHWIWFLCPECQQHSHIEIHSNLIKTGLLDGAPGPCFICCSQMEHPEFFVDTKNDKLICEYNNVFYEFNKKNDGRTK